MNLAHLQDLLDTHGPDPSDWPADVRTAAEHLIAADPAAADACAQARRLEDLVSRHMASAAANDPAAASRVAATLAARPLPRQHRAWRWWPAELAAFDLAPAWPRVAALASVCVLGFALGLVGLGGRFARGLAAMPAANADLDLSGIVFDPDPAIGLRP